MDRDADRAFAILVIVIRPRLCSADIHFSRRIAVRYIVACYFSFVTFYWIFSNRISDLASFLILVQVLKLPAPAICCRHGLALYLCSIRKEVDRDARRTFSVLVLAVIPGLASAHLGLLRRMDVLHVVAVHLAGVSCDIFLGDRIDDLLAILILIQIREVPAPVICCCHDFAVCLCSVFQEIDRDADRAFAVLVIVVRPRLCSADVHNFCITYSRCKGVPFNTFCILFANSSLGVQISFVDIIVRYVLAYFIGDSI